MVIHLIKHFLVIKFSRRMLCSEPSKGSENILLIQCNPVFHFISKSCEQCLCIIDKVIDNLRAFPSLISVHKCLRKIPVVDRHHWFDPVFQTFINDILVKGNAFLINFPFSFRVDSCPGDGKAVGLQSHFCHQCNILFVSVIMINRHIACCRFKCLSRNTYECIPVCYAFAAFLPAAFNLVCGRCAAP